MNQHEVFETLKMIQEEKLDIRTITMGISLLDCADGDRKTSCRDPRQDRPPRGRLAAVGDEIEETYGVPIINKRDLRDARSPWWRKAPARPTTTVCPGARGRRGAK